MFGVGRSLYFGNILKTKLEMHSECAFTVHVQGKYYFSRHLRKVNVNVIVNDVKGLATT